ncbi:hypothetical protein [Enhygromyxa salina]|uniref:Endo-1,4-beta-xylanase A n=1 Tax=Enhygromyxa salina TaxID=215803 RepID=A0A2S9XTB1_9BACT|nr:hypothetical protein [Enhygromyxa salina]PRP96083.1 hypothetical protein ENSA7_68970 [Enhygromyxa salina]
MTTRNIYLASILLLTIGACSDEGDGDQFASLTTTSVTLSNNGSNTNGDGDGDEDETSGTDTASTAPGDGDPDPTTGDGDGDPDPTTGDGDGDPDPTTGDGDGDGDGDDPVFNCGWLEAEAYYACGGNGEDPDGVHPSSCPANLVEGEPCGELSGEGCCDGNGDNWYCGTDGQTEAVVLDVCG